MPPAVSIDLADANVWDDSALVKSWNTAVQEYRKYHSIHAKGQKLSDVLTKEELHMLMSNGVDAQKLDEGDVLAGENDGAQPADGGEEENGDAPMIESEDEPVANQARLVDARNDTSIEKHADASAANSTVGVAPPQVLINSVKDEGIRNLMMSWYWAGYYTGLHEGQQRANGS